MSGSYELEGKSKAFTAPNANGNQAQTPGVNGQYPSDNPPTYNNGAQYPPINPMQAQPAPAPMQPSMVSNAFMSNTSNTVVVNQPGADNSKDRLVLVRKSQLQGRSWNSGICGCCNDLMGCLFGTFCLPCLLVRLANRLNECAFLTCCVPGGLMTLRTQLRVMGGIKGSICKDCVASTCCLPCVACQMSREMNDMQL